MKLYYLWLFDGKIESGVNKKIFSQIKSLNNLDIDANLILIGNTDKIELPSPHVIKESINNNEKKNLFNRLFYSRKIANIWGNRIKNFESSDFLYIRYPILISSCPIVFFKPFRKCKVIFDYNSIENKEFLLNHHYFYFILEYFFGIFIRSQADGGICVTNEIENYQRKKIGSRNTSFVTIGNGIDVNSVNLRKPPQFNQHELSVLCVAQVQRWHGIDRIIAGIASYYGPLSIKLHIAGDGAEIPQLKRMVEEECLTDKVFFHGFVSGTALDKIFDQCHIGVGSLGIHRKGLCQTSELKIREYCSRGIPFVLACSDPDFPDDFPYLLRLPSNETPIDIEELNIFVSRVYKNIDHPQRMRQYAIENLDWSVKMTKFKCFLENLNKKDILIK